MKLLALALCVAACGGGDAATDAGGPPGSFIAFSSTFQPFRTWPHFTDDLEDTAHYTADVLGPRDQYINKLPPHGSTEFPVGTVIVEVRKSMTPNIIFAAVKRGASFNPTGALNWEWFELLEGTDGAVTYKWRGVGPPNGETYGGDPNGGCNSCHAACGGPTPTIPGQVSNDYVCSPNLQLSGF